MKTHYDVIGLGNAIMDIIAPVSDAFLTEHNMDKGGMALIDQTRALSLNKALSANGETQEIAGGSAANTMVGISALGCRVGYIGKVANDAIGKRLSNGFANVGVDFTTKPIKSGEASARCMIAVTPDGERTMNTFLGASSLFTSSDIAKAKIQAADVLYLEGYLFDAEPAKKAFIKASEIAGAAGRKVALTLSDSFCVGRHRESFKDLVDNHVDILFANEDEILSLYETDRLDTSLDALNGTKTVACITRGDKGYIIQDHDRRHLVLAAPVDKVVDTTGAGDQYAAGVLAGRAMGMNWKDAGYLGSLCAAEVISHYGARPEKSIHEIASKA